MKKSIFLLALIIVGIIAKANDLIVEENGLPPSYSSIKAALAAANSGDRIFVKNKAGNIPWVENDTIAKSVSILAYQYDSIFIVQGAYTISPVSTDTINIIGMLNMNGSITCNTAPSGSRTIVRILNSQFSAGNILCANNNYDLTVQGCNLDGYIAYEHGSIVGNIIHYVSLGIQVTSESIVTTDTSYILGNQITTTSGGSGISWSSNTMIFDIRNNFIVCQAGDPINVQKTVSNSSQLNKLYNNTVSVTDASSGATGIFIASSTGSQVDVQNNVLDITSTIANTYGFGETVGTGSNLFFTYNYIDQAFATSIQGTPTVNMDNVVTSITLNANGSTQSNVGVNSGNPGPQFYDTDLTVNDAGCYGGSFTLKNFFPTPTIGPSAWVTNYTFNLRTGNTLGIKASSYSK